MIPNKDAYGQEILAYFKGKKVPEIIERDDGHIDLSGGPEIYFSKYKEWHYHEKKALKFVKGRVLDVGCGAGRISLYLQNKGFDVVGIDNSPLAAKVCKQRGFKKVKVIPISEVDKLKSTFDSIIMFGNNFGLFGSFKKARILLKKFSEITSQNAVIIAESLNPYKTNNPVHIEYHKLNKKRGRMVGQLKIRVRFEKCIGDWFDYLFVSKQEMKEIFKGTGWKIKGFIDSKSPHYIAIIEKISN